MKADEAARRADGTGIVWTAVGGVGEKRTGKRWAGKRKRGGEDAEKGRRDGLGLEKSGWVFNVTIL